MSNHTQYPYTFQKAKFKKAHMLKILYNIYKQFTYYTLLDNNSIYKFIW